MNTATVVMIAIAVVLLLVGYLQGDNLHLAGLNKGGNMLVQVFPLLIAAFVVPSPLWERVGARVTDTAPPNPGLRRDL